MAFPTLHTPRLHNPSSLDRSTCCCSILAHVKKGEFRHALALYQKAEADTLAVLNANAFVALLKACSELFNVAKGQEIHKKVEELGFLGRDVRVGNAVINMYMKCGYADKARESFDAMAFRNVVTWNSIIAGYAGNGHAEHALACFRSMRGDGIFPDAVTVICVLKACAMARSMAEGQEIHAEIARKACSWMGMDLGSALVSMYARCGCSAKAQEAFDRLPDRDAVTWNSLIAGYVQDEGQEWKALECLTEMRSQGISPDAITLSYTLKACGSIGCASLGKEIHGEIVKKGYVEQQQDTFLHCGVVDMYAKCGCLGAAQEAFESFGCADVASWNALITGYVEQGQEGEAMDRFELLVMEGGTSSSKTCPDMVTYRGVMKACGGLKDARKARQMHMEVTRKGWEKSAGMESLLVDVYAKCGLLVEAQELLRKLRNGTSAMPWNALMLGYIEAGRGKDALDCFLRMQRSSAFPGDAVSFVCILKACVVHIGDATVVGYGFHTDITRRGFLDCGELLLVGSALVDLYAKRGLLAEAECVLCMLAIRDVVCWTALIDGYAETEGLAAKALECLEAMKLHGVSPNAVTYASILKACGAMGDVDKAREMHSEVVELGLLDMDHPAGNGSIIASSLIEMYGSCGARAEAEQVLYNAANKDRDTASWTAFIAVCSKGGDNNNVLEHMEVMRRVPCAAAYACSLKACKGASSARAIHAEMVKRGMELGLARALLHAYCRCCGCLPEAEHMFFDGLEEEERDAGAWNALIAGYVKHGRADEAFGCLHAMEHACICFTVDTYAHALQVDDRDDGGRAVQLHCRLVKHGLEREASIASALVDAYAKLGMWEEACTAVGDMERMARDVGTTTMLLSCLRRSARVGWLHACREAHATIARLGLHGGMLVANSLLDAYAKCGLLQEVEGTFNALTVRDIVSWTSLITAYSQLAMPQDVLGAFAAMLADHIQPNSVTFSSILNSACHGGLVEEAKIWFLAICNHYRLVPSVEHFACLVDLFGRADLVHNAVLTIANMPFHPNIVVWRIVLASCQRSGHVDFAIHAFHHSMELDRNDPASYVYMFNVCTVSAR